MIGTFCLEGTDTALHETIVIRIRDAAHRDGTISRERNSLLILQAGTIVGVCILPSLISVQTSLSGVFIWTNFYSTRRGKAQYNIPDDDTHLHIVAGTDRCTDYR